MKVPKNDTKGINDDQCSEAPEAAPEGRKHITQLSQKSGYDWVGFVEHTERFYRFYFKHATVERGEKK